MDQGRGTPRDSGGGTGVVAEQVKQQGQQAVHQTQQAAGQAVQQAQQQAQTFLDGQKSKGAETLSSVAEALRQTGDQLRQQQQAPAAQVADKTAEQLNRVSSYLNGHSANDLVADVEDFGRQNSVLFLGAAFTLGVFAARFLKSSSPSTDGQSRNYGPGGRGGQYNTARVAYPYENVGNTPYVEHGYAEGMMVTPTTGYASETTGFTDDTNISGSDIDGTPAH